MIWTLLLIISSHAYAESLKSVGPNNRGVFELKEGNTYSAYQNFAEALSEDALDPRLHLNLGLTFVVNKEFDKGIKEYETADILAQNHAELRFAARFNKALAYQEMGEIDKALESYQQALEINPDSNEVKTNIELLWQAQSKSGGGSGQKKQKSDDKESKDSEGGQKDEDKNQQEGASQNEEPKENQPKPFESKELTEQAMKKILEELKAQEQKVRADHYSKGAKEMPRDKDW